MVMRALLIALAVVVAWAGFQTIRAGRLKAEAVALRAENATLEREAVGQAEISTATETFHTREIFIREVASQATAENEQADDASTPLSVERGDRLRSHDRVLCERTGVCAASADDADRGAEDVRSVDPAA